MPLVPSLLDQIYTSRRQLNALTGAVRLQLDEVRNAILKLLDHPGVARQLFGLGSVCRCDYICQLEPHCDQLS